jgi:RNA polymerase sigma factor (TIGR02999 family)
MERMSGEENRTTRLLERYLGGEREVEVELLERVYGELRELAGAHMRGQSPGHTLQPTALMHEAWMRIAGQEELEFGGRSQFYALASKVMRSVLVDHARRQNREKRGGGRGRMTLDPALDADEGSAEPSVDLLDLEQGLERLEEIDPDLTRVVEMRFFGGLSHPEIAEATGASLRTVERNWRTARAWLQANLSP